eukprot:403375941
MSHLSLAKAYLAKDNCNILVDFNYFNLKDLEQPNQDYNISSIKFPSGKSYHLLLNFCQQNLVSAANNLLGTTCQGYTDTQAVLYNSQECIIFSQQTQSHTSYSVNITDEIDDIDNIYLTYGNGQTCKTNSHKQYSIVLQPQCTKLPAGKITQNFNVDITDSCQLTVSFQYACNKRAHMNMIWRWLYSNRYVFGPLSIICGLIFLLTQHEQSHKIAILNYYLVTVIASVIATFLFLYIFIFYNNGIVWIGWAIFGAGILLGSILSYISYKTKRFVGLIIGALSGFFLACVLQNAVVFLISYEFSFHILIGAMCFITLCSTQIFLEHAFDCGFAIIGAFLLMRGVGMFLDYKFEFLIYYEFHVFYTMPSVDPFLYIYTASFLVITILSALVKLRIKNHNLRKNLHPYYVIN